MAYNALPNNVSKPKYIYVGLEIIEFHIYIHIYSLLTTKHMFIGVI